MSKAIEVMAPNGGIVVAEINSIREIFCGTEIGNGEDIHYSGKTKTV